MVDFGNLYGAYRAARRGKRDRVSVADFEFDLEHNLLQLQEERSIKPTSRMDTTIFTSTNLIAGWSARRRLATGWFITPYARR